MSIRSGKVAAREADTDAAEGAAILPASRAVRRMSRLAAAALVIANLIVLLAAASQKWGYAHLVAIFWWETLIIGLYNLGRIFVVCLLGNPLGSRIGIENPGTRILLALGLAAFFIVKFGGFLLATGVLVLMMPAALEHGGQGNNLANVADAAAAVGGTLISGIVALLLSHGVSFFRNFIGRREYRRAGVLGLLFWPYARLSLMVVIALLGLAAAGSVPALARAPLFTAFIVLVKLIADAATHRFEHRQREAP